MMNAPRVRQRSEEAAAGSLFNGSSSAAALLDVPLIEAAERCAHALTTRNEGTYSLYASREGTCNWARNVVYSAPRVLYPATIQELGDLVRCAKKCRGLGSRHSFSRVADTTGDLISPMMAGISINAKARTVRCGAGTTYAALAQALLAAGWAIHNLASLPHISVVGALMTATHGSGMHLGNLATALLSCEFVDARGALNACADANTMQAVMLGAIGLVTEVTLAIEPSFDLRQDVYVELPWKWLQDSDALDAVFGEAYSVSLFIDDWASERGASQAWFKRRAPGYAALAPAAPVLFGAKLSRRQLHPIASESAVACTHQGEPPGPWCERLPHFRADDEPSSRGDELQSEYFVARADAPAAIEALRRIGGALQPFLQVSELRVVAADELWLSPCYKREALGIHFTWVHNMNRVVMIALQLVEAALSPFRARPHWGKLFAMSPASIATLYPRLSDYRELVTRLDPAGKFRNTFIDRYILAAPVP